MNRYLATSLAATTMGSILVFVTHGCAINVFGDRDFEKANEEAAKDKTSSIASTSGGGGAGGAGGTAGAGGATGCTCIDDGNACTDDVVGQACPGGDEKACHTVVANRSCTQNDGKSGYCDDTAACKSCDECSDAACMKRCNGQVCESLDVCVSGNCVDGFCCDSDCMGECNACNRVPGTCQPLPVGMAGECPMGQLCGNTVSCKTTAKKALGELCGTSNAACESGVCVGQICVSLNGQPCVEHLECASRLCDPTTHTCVACAVDADCPGGAACQANKTCQVLLGQPAVSMSMECKPLGAVADGLTCTLPMGAACTNNFECAHHDCNGAPNAGTCAATCMVDAECPPGTTCNKDKGWCLLPAGSYCVIDDQCQGPMNTIGTCTGFPRKCQ